MRTFRDRSLEQLKRSPDEIDLPLSIAPPSIHLSPPLSPAVTIAITNLRQARFNGVRRRGRHGGDDPRPQAQAPGAACKIHHLNTKFLVCDTKLLVLNSKFIIFNSRRRREAATPCGAAHVCLHGCAAVIIL